MVQRPDGLEVSGLCECGHYISDHEWTLLRPEEAQVPEPCNECDCKNFSESKDGLEYYEKHPLSSL